MAAVTEMVGVAWAYVPMLPGLVEVATVEVPRTSAKLLASALLAVAEITVIHPTDDHVPCGRNVLVIC